MGGRPWARRLALAGALLVLLAWAALLAAPALIAAWRMVRSALVLMAAPG